MTPDRSLSEKALMDALAQTILSPLYSFLKNEADRIRCISQEARNESSRFYRPVV